MEKILIVEDDPLMLRMYQRIFALENFTVDVAENGQEALEKVMVFRPALILLDIMMPKMNGMQALEALKANPQTSNIPVIMLTNLAGQQDAEEALRKGAAKYIIKSEYEPKQIAEIVRGMLMNNSAVVGVVPQVAPVVNPSVENPQVS
jgi:CheY-like chemotaxis protein